MALIRSDDKLPIEQEYLDHAVEFLKYTKIQRIAEIEKLIKKHKDKEESEQEMSLKREALNLINAIETTLYESSQDKISLRDIFEEIHKCRSYLHDRGAATKMLLEHLALILPETK